MPLQRDNEAGVFDTQCGGAGEDDQVHMRQASAMTTEGLAGEPFQPIAVDRPAGLFLGDRKAEAGRAGPGRRSQDREEGIR